MASIKRAQASGLKQKRDMGAAVKMPAGGTISPMSATASLEVPVPLTVSLRRRKRQQQTAATNLYRPQVTTIDLHRPPDLLIRPLLTFLPLVRIEVVSGLTTTTDHDAIGIA